MNEPGSRPSEDGLRAEAIRIADRALYLAVRLCQMIDRETWRATGGDDGQGHYEGDYHAEMTETELLGLRASLDALSTRPVSPSVASPVPEEQP